jgi:DNA-binding NarL/FixJ family response regulator
MGITVAVVDQEAIFTDALAARLQAEEDVEVVAGLLARAPLPCVIVGRQADVMLLDADLPGDAAARLCEELSEREDAPRVILLSHTSEPQRILETMQAGAAAWLCKDASLEDLLRVIRGVARGETWLPPAQTGAVLRLLLAERDRQLDSNRLLATLTPREREVLACLSEGAGRRDVAERLHVSAHTVRTHLQNIMAKLGVHSVLEAMALTRSPLD